MVIHTRSSAAIPQVCQVCQCSRARPMRAVATFVDTVVRVPACGTAIEPLVPPVVPTGFRGGGGRESGPAAGPGTSSRISAGNHSAVEAHDITSTGAWCTQVGWQHEERYRTRGGRLRTSLSRIGGYKRYRPTRPRLLYAFSVSVAKRGGVYSGLGWRYRGR